MLDNIGNWLTPAILKRIAGLARKDCSGLLYLVCLSASIYSFCSFCDLYVFELVFNQEDRKMTGLDLCLLLSVLFLGGLGILGARYNAKRHEKEA